VHDIPLPTPLSPLGSCPGAEEGGKVEVLTEDATIPQGTTLLARGPALVLLRPDVVAPEVWSTERRCRMCTPTPSST
jgi:hypothetical protein